MSDPHAIDDLLSEYCLTLDKYGLVTNLGKFERETVATVYYHNAMMNGDGDPDSEGTVFFVTDWDVETFGQLGYHPGDAVILQESNEGFVTLSDWTPAED